MTMLVRARNGITNQRMRAAFAAAVLLVALGTASTDASAQAAYPNRPIRMIVPYPPGSGTDFTAREVATLYSKALGQPVVMDNRPGAAATLGHAIAAKSPP